ncbi:MAG: DUF3795 domain-containing protein [Deltaproteobacteria bacterium]|nr:DUF3795 domain-containing protein [Deltaproteobacteria bacterium]
MPAQMYGCCGLVCSECPAYLATQANDRAKAEETAQMWSRQFGIEVRVEHVWCDGCTAPGRKCAHCAECEIRSCATGRNLATCAPCADYPCKQLEAFFQMVPMAKASLDRLRAGA